MGKTIVKVKMWNMLDEEQIINNGKKAIEIDAQVDTGATTTVISTEIVEKLNLKKSGRTRGKYADGRVEERDVVVGVGISTLGRDTVCRAIVEPKIKTPLLGQIVLEDWDLWVDSKSGTLRPNPESPDMTLLDEL